MLLTMVSLTPEQVRHIAKLARLRLTESEVQKFSTELTSILQYVEKLKEVPTDNIEPTAQVTGLVSRFREDEIRPGLSPEELLASSPLPIVDQQIETPSAHG